MHYRDGLRSKIGLFFLERCVDHCTSSNDDISSVFPLLRKGAEVSSWMRSVRMLCSPLRHGCCRSSLDLLMSCGPHALAVVDPCYSSEAFAWTIYVADLRNIPGLPSIVPKGTPRFESVVFQEEPLDKIGHRAFVEAIPYRENPTRRIGPCW